MTENKVSFYAIVLACIGFGIAVYLYFSSPEPIVVPGDSVELNYFKEKFEAKLKRDDSLNNVRFDKVVKRLDEIKKIKKERSEEINNTVSNVSADKLDSLIKRELYSGQ